MIGVLENLKEIKKLPLQKKSMVRLLKKKDIEAVLQSLREMYE